MEWLVENPHDKEQSKPYASVPWYNIGVRKGYAEGSLAQLQSDLQKFGKEIIPMVQELASRPCFAEVLGEDISECNCPSCTAKIIIEKWQSLLQEAGEGGE